MYIGTDLSEKFTAEEVGIDQLNFSLSISEQSIPFLNKYGIDINESASNIESILKDKIKLLINKLSNVVYSDFSIDTSNKTVNIKVYCGGKLISRTINI